MLHLEVQLGLTALVLLVRFSYSFHVDHVYGVGMCRNICQMKDCCVPSYDEKHLKCEPNLKYPIVLNTGAEFGACTVLTRRVHTRARGEQVVTDCILGHNGNLEQGTVPTSNLREAYSKGDVCQVKNIFTSKRHIVDLEQRYEEGATVLMLAAYDGNKEMFDLFVREGASLTVTSDDNETLLMLATQNAGNIDIVKYILNNSNVDINSADKDGLTALFSSCIANKSAIFELIIAAGGDLNKVDNKGHSILNYACSSNNIGITRYILTHYNIEEHQIISKHINVSLIASIIFGYVEIVDLLVKYGGDLSIVNRENSSTLAEACKSKNTAMVEYVLSKKCVPINAMDKDGITPFLVAASNGTVEIMKILVANGCNTNVVDFNGLNALHHSCKSGKLDHVEYILETGFIKDVNRKGLVGFTALHFAVESNNTDVFDILVSSGADLAVADMKRRNCLHLACKNGHLEMVRKILQLTMNNFNSSHHLSVNSRGEIGRTPLFEATSSGVIDIMDVLVHHGGDTHVTDDDGNTILHEAIRIGQVHIVSHILEKKYVNIESRGQYGYTPILAAAYYGEMLVFKSISKHGCYELAFDDDKNNIFHVACCGGHVEIVKYIREAGYIRELDQGGWMDRTPVLLAAYYGHRKVLEHLQGLGCDMSAVDCDGNNVLHLAIMMDHTELAIFLIDENILDVKLVNSAGLTPGTMALRKRNFAVIEVLS